LVQKNLYASPKKERAQSAPAQTPIFAFKVLKVHLTRGVLAIELWVYFVIYGNISDGPNQELGAWALQPLTG
jgi:hypothetical protein